MGISGGGLVGLGGGRFSGGWSDSFVWGGGGGGGMGVGEWGGSGPLFEEIINVGAGDCAGLTGGRRIYREGQHRFKGAEFYGALNFGRHGVAAFGALCDCF